MHDYDKGNADNVLIAVGFYIGEKKKYDGALPFVIVAAITVFAMLFSEVILIVNYTHSPRFSPFPPLMMVL